MKTGMRSFQQPPWNVGGNPEYNATILYGRLDPDQGADMGEIRASVRLTNSFDQMLFRRGQLPKDQVRTYEAGALVDTGAVRSVIPVHVMQLLGVAARGQRLAEYADGRKEVVEITEPIVFQILGRDTPEEALVLGDEVLIGQTALEKLDLLADCKGRRLIPNPAHPDQPVSKVKSISG